MKIMFVTTKKNQCGVHQYGLDFYEAIRQNGEFDIEMVKVENFDEITEAGMRINPDLIIYNYHPGAFRFLNEKMSKRYNITSIVLLHEPKLFDFSQLKDGGIFQYAIYGDCGTTNYLKPHYESGRLIPMGRVILNFQSKAEKPKIPTFGTIGFAVLSKGFDKIINLVQNEFDEAIIRFNIPMNNSVFNDEEGARKYDEYFKGLVTKPNIKLEITHNFYNKEEFLDYLASNSVNIFPYEQSDNHGALSSSFDNALMSKSAIAITKSDMFRHVLAFNLPITLEDHSLKQIYENGSSVLEPLRKEWNVPKFSSEFVAMMKKIINKEKNITQFNRILDESARVKYAPVIEKLFEITPEMMSRKIPRANVQQAFALDTIEYCLNEMGVSKKDAKLLCIGSYEDTCCDALIKMGYNVTEIEPRKNYDLNQYYTLPTTEKNSFDIVFSISVLEHVDNDTQFMEQAYDLLKPNGYGVITVDYNDVDNSRYPDGSFRLYSQKQLRDILPLLKNAKLLDEPNWNCPNPDFDWGGCKYTFATLVFKKGA